MASHHTDTLIIGAGIIGIATAYYLKKMAPEESVTIVEQDQPMAFTSAQSGENYRNWWPHPTMKKFTEHSIDLMEQISDITSERINMTRRGYILATRENDISDLVSELTDSYSDSSLDLIRYHNSVLSNNYQPAESEAWQSAPDGVDILESESLVKKHFANFDPDVKNIIHIRRAGILDSQQLGSFMLEEFKVTSGKRITGKVINIEKGSGFSVEIEGQTNPINATRIINCAGPFLNEIAQMLDVQLPVTNVLQQKIAFPDTLNAIPRKQPFAIDLDPQIIDWDEEEKNLLEKESEFAWLTQKLPGAIHCRPEGGDNSNWLKLGWAFNESSVTESWTPELDDFYPEIVLRGAARLNPALKSYYGKLPRKVAHYGGYYTSTEENWPLIGKTTVEGFFVNGAMSGFGTMAACASGELCAQWVLDEKLPDYAEDLSLERYNNLELMEQLNSLNKGKL